MPYISKNVWCQAHYIQQHHQEEREEIFGGLFFVFSIYIYSWNSLWKFLWRLHILRDSCFFVVGDDESTMFLWSWKSGQTLGFTKGKSENQGLVLWTAELIQYQTDTPRKDRRVRKSDFSTWRTRTVSLVQARVSSGYYGNKGMQWALGTKTPSNFSHIWTLMACNSFWEHLGEC